MPIAITLDLHAIVTSKMVALAPVYVSYKTYPHVDMRETGRMAGRLLDRVMRGEVKPVTLCARLPMLEEANSGRTDVEQTRALYESTRRYETEPGILAVSINACFAEADVVETGVTVLVTYDTGTEGAEARAKAIADSIADTIWKQRGQVSNQFLTPAEAAAQARDFDFAKGPLVIADYADNPGAGAYGDAPGLLKALIEAGATGGAFAPMIDPDAAAILHKGKVGDVVTIELGGKQDPTFGGGPLRLEGKIIHLSDGSYTGKGPILGGITHSFGPTAVFRTHGIDVLVVTISGQMLDLEQVRAFGIEPTEQRFLVVKSMQHFRADFEPVAGRVIVADSGALATPQAHLRPYRKIPRPMWPLDRDFER
jgi:microcystin degradation protein MlrC